MKDLTTGLTVILPQDGRSFDPTRISKAVEDAGFSTPKVEIVVAGRLERTGESWELQVSGLGKPFALEGGAQIDALRSRPDLDGTRATVTGFLKHTEVGDIPALSVEALE